MKVHRLYFIGILIGTLMVACGTDNAGESGATSLPEQGTSSPSTTESEETTDPGTPDPSRVPSTTTAPPVLGEVPDEILAEILEDAVRRTGVDIDQLDVIRSEFVEWPDGSLGCPEPGKFYTQAIVSGYWVEIEAPDETLDYRVTGEGNFKICESGILPPSQGGFVTPTTPDSDS